jgi:hypothetical protein
LRRDLSRFAAARWTFFPQVRRRFLRRRFLSPLWDAALRNGNYHHGIAGKPVERKRQKQGISA